MLTGIALLDGNTHVLTPAPCSRVLLVVPYPMQPAGLLSYIPVF